MADEAQRFYRHLQQVFAGGRGTRRKRLGAAEEESSQPFTSGRDPRGLADIVGKLVTEYGWNSPLAEAQLLVEWEELLGPDTARHAKPVGIHERQLVVQCDSTAWAQQLRLMRQSLLDKIAHTHPDAGIDSIRFLIPDAPSWKHGPRAIPGRGPRDTYG